MLAPVKGEDKEQGKLFQSRLKMGSKATSIVSQLLNEKNYRDWSVQMKLHLIDQGLLDIAESTTERPRKKDDDDQNSMALEAIKKSCGPTILPEIEGISSAKVIWDTLEEKCDNQNVADKETDDNNLKYIDLLKGVKSGDWNATKEFLERHPRALTAKIMFLGKTALHFAVLAGNEHIAEKLVQLMSKRDLEIQGKADGLTPLAEAAVLGNCQMTKCMLRKNENLVNIAAYDDRIPVVMAFQSGHKELGRYLYCLTPKEDLMPDKGRNGATVLTQAIYNGILGRTNPNLIWCSDNKHNRGIFECAVLYRQAKIFSLIYGLAAKNVLSDTPDLAGNKLLHMAAIIEPLAQLNRISVAALQMQRELQWFKEVENVVLPKVAGARNLEGLTARELFTKNHQDLMKKGEDWMKGTATSLTVVCTLIISIMFGAAYTVPGVDNYDKSLPWLFKRKLATIFIIADVLSLFSSSTSLLTFLGILTSRYAEEDFLKSLPTKMILGLSTLSFSIATMTIAFTTSLLLLLHEQSWITIPILCLASIPITMFASWHLPLLIEMVNSTYGPSIFDRKRKCWF